MPETRNDPNECVIYTDGFRNRIQGNVVFPTQVFGKTTLLDFVNQHDSVMVERYRRYRREGSDFVPDQPLEVVDPNLVAYIPTANISLMHGYVQYGALSKFDDERLASLGYEEIPVFLQYVIAAAQHNEMLYGRVLGKIPRGHRDPMKARLDAVEEVLKSRPRFIAVRDPENPLLRKWFEQEDWSSRKHHQQIPPSVVLNRHHITFFGLQKTAAAAAAV